LSEELKNAENHFIIAYVDGAAAGYAKFRAKRPEKLEATDPLEIERIYVLCACHGKKVGAALMGHCLTYARDNGHDVVWLGVWEHNHKAVSFYRQWGFELFGDHTFRLGSDIQTDVLMKKVL
jgi:ribosomal protein S18 acetylase RimI-like enzyme